MLIVADTSALVALAACQQLHLLEVLFDTIVVEALRLAGET